MVNRRSFIKNTLASSIAISAFSSVLLVPKVAFSGVKEFAKISKVVKTNIGSLATGVFKFKTPKLAENGALVPLTVDATDIAGVTQIAFYVKNNNTPLVAVFTMSNGSLGYVSTRIKMAESSEVSAIISANGKVSVRTNNIKVTVGGCGG